MNISEVFIRRPIATSLLMAAIAMFGIVAYRALPVSDLPTVDFPTIQVRAGLPGGDPGSMAASVASPLERQFTTIAGVDSMISQSSMGNTQVTLQFDLGRPIDSAAVDVQTAIAEAMPLLPAGMPNPPTFRKQNPADQDILQLALISNTVPLSVLDEYAETFIAPRISMVNGVSQVQVWGQSKYAVRVQVDPDKLRAQQIGIERSRSGAAELERQPADGPAVRLAPDVQHQGRRPADQRRSVQAGHHCVPAGPSGPARAGRERPRQRRGHHERDVVLHDATAARARSTSRSSASPASTRSK